MSKNHGLSGKAHWLNEVIPLKQESFPCENLNHSQDLPSKKSPQDSWLQIGTFLPDHPYAAELQWDKCLHLTQFTRMIWCQLRQFEPQWVSLTSPCKCTMRSQTAEMKCAPTITTMEHISHLRLAEASDKMLFLKTCLHLSLSSTKHQPTGVNKF